MRFDPTNELPYPLLERDVETRRIEQKLQWLRAGHGGVLVVEGSAGMGRSSLLKLLYQRASEAGFCVLRARGHEFEGDVPFGAVAQLLEPAVPARVVREPPEVASPAMLGQLRNDLLELAGDRRLVVVVDDARWMDMPSLRFLNYLGARAERTPMLLAVALDPADRGSAVDWLGGVSTSLETTLLRLAPLSEAATHHLVSLLLGPASSPEFAAACFDATGGNPLLLHEVLAEVATGRSGSPEEALSGLSRRPPARVMRQLVRRLQNLPRSSLAVARAVAVLGVAEDPVVVSRTADCLEADVDDAVTALVDAEVMTDGPALRFAQPMLRTAVYAGIPAFLRGRLHARAARALAETGAPSEVVAEQLVNVPPAVVPPAAVGELVEPRSRIRRTVRHLRPVPGDDPVQRASAALDAARALTLDCQFEEAVAVLEPAIAGVRDPTLRPRLEATEVWIAQLSPSTRDGGRARLGNVERPHLAGKALLEEIWRGTLAEHIGRLTGDLLHRPRMPAGDSVGWSAGLVAAVTLAHFDRLAEARQAVLTLRDAANQTETMLAGLDLCLRAAVDYQLGDIAGAGDLALQVLSGTDGQRPARMVRAFAAAVRAETLIVQGTLDAAAATIEETGLIDDGAADTIAVLPLLRARGRLRIAQDQLEEGLHDLLRGRRAAVDLGLTPGAWVSWSSAVTALHRLGRTEEALVMARDELAGARSCGAPAPLAAALRTLGLLTPGPAALPLVEEAATLMEGFPGQLEKARTQLTYGIVLRRVGKSAAARVQLRLAAETSGVHGAHVLNRRAIDELRSIEADTTGRRSRTVLTPRQQRVAELAAEGMPNEKIAQSLFVTVKTVEWHLTQAYRKLGIESRGALSSVLAATTLDYAESA
ncbi:LuxR C-terminal-related transcriptional regulator [Micromonospora sp. NPDC023888]|uniref:AAA family ATPase n=1 Tax=Micromonospora sp. NPDC023888 TaxID=3155607 RepID=UPI0033E5B964